MCCDHYLSGFCMSLENLHQKILSCKKCRLYRGALHAVPGEGPIRAKIMLVGQNPGGEEDKVGRPFVGRSGKFLNKVLVDFGFKREDIFITSIVKHVTPGNRAPLMDEVEACVPYLTIQIQEINPKIVVLMGKTAYKTPRFEGIEYLMTCHPSAAMRFPKERQKFLKDFKLLREKTC